MDDELLDWEVLHGSDTESITSDEKSKSSSVFDDGMILSDHFSATDLTQSGLIEPGVGYVSEESPVVVDLGDTCVRNELGIYDSKVGVSGYGDFGADDVESQSRGNELVSGDSEIVNGEEEILSTEEVEAVRYGGDSGEVRLSDFEADDEKNLESKSLSGSDEIEVANGGRHVESESNVEEPIEDLSKSWSDSGGNELVSRDSEIVNGEEEIVATEAVRCGDESESRSKEIVWWKMPFVLLKYSVFKIGPVWSVSMAAAVMGLVLLGRRLYNMKKKAQSFHLKVTIDDKKVSRVMSQAARLNEVFTEVRRVPVIRSALPSPVAWPVLSLR